MKHIIKITAVLALLGSVIACQKDSRPNYQYMPNMYESVGYETYREYPIFDNITGGSEAMLPAEGSIARGWMPYGFENNPEGYAAAKDSLANPLLYTEENLETGKELYEIYCAICHGNKGDGQGYLAQREKILGIPAYNDIGRAITEGSIYHVMYFGLNTMGSYASQLSEEEMWKIDHYVISLKDKLDKKPERTFETAVEEKMMADTDHEDQGEVHEESGDLDGEHHEAEDNDESH